MQTDNHAPAPPAEGGEDRLAEIRALVEEYRRETPGEYQRAVARSIEGRAEHDMPWLVDRIAALETEQDRLRRALTELRDRWEIYGGNATCSDGHVGDCAGGQSFRASDCTCGLAALESAIRNGIRVLGASVQRPDYSIVHAITTPDAPEGG